MKILYRLFLFACASFGLCLSYSRVQAQVVATDVVAKVNGVPVTVQELRQYADRNRHTIYQQYKSKYPDAPAAADFWLTKFANETPAEVLKQKALQDAILLKIQQIMLQEKGLLRDPSYTSFLKELAEVNQIRSAAIKAGGIIYGPVTYSEKEYFNYRLSNQLIALKRKLSESEITITEADLQAHFQVLKSRLYPEHAPEADEADAYLRHKNFLYHDLTDLRYNRMVEERLAAAIIVRTEALQRLVLP